MNDILYRLIDASHGGLLIALLVVAGKLMMVRRNGAVQLRYCAGAYLLVSCIQSVVLFLAEGDSNTTTNSTISIWMDLLGIIASIGMVVILIRNRHLYKRKTIGIVCGMVLAQWCCYGLCAALHFADWTSLVYIPISGLLWAGIGFTIDRAQVLSPEKAIITNTGENPFVQELNRILINDRYFCREDLTRDMICRKMTTNRTTFSSRLREATGMTFSEYLRELRLREAARLLRETDMPIDQVAYDVGLRSASGFHRNFLLSYGITPNAYRAQHTQ